MFGLLNLNKPEGMTSRDVVNIVQRLVKPAKAGHAGTLDPLATGVLLVCVGPATRLISLLQQAPKTYLAEFALGQRSDTDDSTGVVEVDESVTTPPTQEQIKEALTQFQGPIEQIPPAYSAIKVGGKRAYALARQGQDVELAARTVHVHAIRLLQYEWPNVVVEVECGSGTYIRSIARDLGESLGCGGLMTGLQRTRIGRFSIGDAVDPQTLTADNLANHLISAVRIVEEISTYRCTQQEASLVEKGRSFPVNKSQLTKRRPGQSADKIDVGLLSADGDQLLAMAELRRQGRKMQPRIVFR
jgi:tRNA pseudouridine55 synthase